MSQIVWVTRVLGALALCAGCSSSSKDTKSEATDASGDASGDASQADAGCASGNERNGPYELVTIENNPGAKGAIDPSVEYAEGAEFGLMTYTTVPDEAHVRIAIATSVDSGASWHYTADVTQSTPLTISTTDTNVCGAASCTGTLAHESSSLVLDPFDPDANRRLKVFVHSYFFGTKQEFLHGYLAMYTAAVPSGPWTENKLFGWSSPSPFSSQDVAYNVTNDPRLPEMHDCFIVGEPGALVRAPDIIDLALSCPVVKSASATIEVRLLRSTDHGQTWKFVSTLLTPDDATTLGSTTRQINGSDLFFANGRYHLIATPGGEVDFPGGSSPGYRGCIVMPIADIDTGQVERCAGAPVVESAYLGQPGQFVGACTADVGASKNGMLIPVPNFIGGIDYRIYAAGLPLP